MAWTKNGLARDSSVNFIVIVIGSLGGLGIGLLITKSIAYAVSSGIAGGITGLARHFVLEKFGYKVVRVKTKVK